ncbi:MAG: hypothetical protein DRN15_07160 [Thermoprotei archaeon]|mgnify:CR=1 FL=1|nr:MAG: hypothetical protein DRN15_07160 [Thermoprotei archaeon]
MRAAASKHQSCKLKSEHKTATFRKFGRSATSRRYSERRSCKKFGRSRKRGPKDGWNGLTLKILRYVVEKDVVTRREIEKAFGLTRNAVLYHLKKLREWGLIVKVGRGPATMYVFNHKLCDGLASWEFSGSRADSPSSNGASNVLVEGLRRICRLSSDDLSREGVGFRALVRVWLALCYYRERGRAVSARELAEKVCYSLRYTQKCLAKLIESGLVIPTGGRRCRLVAYVPVCLPKAIVHVHKHARYHRYRCRHSPKV